MAEPIVRYFKPYETHTSVRERGCFTCQYFRGQWSGGHVVCERFERDRVIRDARIGCAWMREPGSDDD